MRRFVATQPKPVAVILEGQNRSVRVDINEQTLGVKVLSQRHSAVGGGATAKVGVPISQYEVMGLEIPEHTHGRVDFTVYIETVSDVPGCIWDPLTRNLDLWSDGQTS